MKNLTICIDIDGTITNPYHFISYLNEMCNKNITEADCTTVNWSKLYDEDNDKLIEKFNDKYIHSYEEAEVIVGAKEVIDELYNHNNVYFVTARNSKLNDVTTKWLDKNGLSNIEIYMLGSNHKIDKAKELNCDIFIEDNPMNAIQLAQGGIKVLLLDTNYNKDINHENIIRVNNWKEIKELIEILQ